MVSSVVLFPVTTVSIFISFLVHGKRELISSLGSYLHCHAVVEQDLCAFAEQDLCAFALLINIL